MPSSIDIRVEESFPRAFIVAALRLVFVLMAGRAESAEAQDAGNQNQQEFSHERSFRLHAKSYSAMLCQKSKDFIVPRIVLLVR